MCMHAGPFSSARPTAVAFVAVAGVIRRSRPVIMATYRDSRARTDLAGRRPPKKFAPHNVSGSGRRQRVQEHSCADSHSSHTLLFKELLLGTIKTSWKIKTITLFNITDWTETGATTAEKLTGTKVWVPTPGRFLSPAARRTR